MLKSRPFKQNKKNILGWLPLLLNLRVSKKLPQIKICLIKHFVICTR